MERLLTKYSAVTTMITSMMGTSIYFTPLAFKSVGYTYGCIIMAIVVILTTFSLYCIAYTSIKVSTKGSTYSSLAASISPIFKYVVDASVVLNSFTANLCLYRYLSDLIVRAFPALSFFSSDQEIIRKGVVVVLFGPFFALSSHKNLYSLKYMSFATVASIAYFVLLLMGYNSVFFGEEYAKKAMEPTGKGFSIAVPILITAMACQSNMVEVRNEMINDSLKSALFVSIWSAVGGGLAYGLIGLFGYAVFGHGLKGEVLSALADHDSEINKYLATHTIDKYRISSRIAVYVCILIFLGSFPLQLSPLLNTLVGLIPAERQTDRNRAILLTILLMVCFSLVMVKNLSAGLVISIAGATITNAISFLYPFVYFICAKRKLTPITILAGLSILLCISSSVYMLTNILLKKE